MPGLVAFEWGEDGTIALFQNRNNGESSVIKAAAWDETGRVLRSWLGQNGGTGFGYSQKGRFASLVDKKPFKNGSNRSELLPIKFLEGNMSPNDFAKVVARDKGGSKGLAYHLIVGDICSGKLVCISKKYSDKSDVDIHVVAPGVHTLTLKGLGKDEALKTRFTQKLATSPIPNIQQLPKLQEVLQELMIRGPAFVNMIQSETPPYGTTSTIAFAAKRNGEGVFYERYYERGVWNSNEHTFLTLN